MDHVTNVATNALSRYEQPLLPCFHLQSSPPLQVGLLTPEPCPTPSLCTGQVGYVILGMKTTRAARIGDTLHRIKAPVTPLPGFRPAKSMVFAGLFPVAGETLSLGLY